MIVAALLLLAATPVSLTVDLSRNTTARLGPRVRELIEERLAEEGFPVESGAKLKLGVEELHGTLRLSAQVGDYLAKSELRPADEWPAELGFELAQRLAVLAHEAESHLPLPKVEPGDLIAVPVSGAYHLSMSSNYNGACRPAVLWLADGQAQVIQERETSADLLRRDHPLDSTPDHG